MGLKYNPFSGKLDFIGSGGAGICGTVGSNNNSVLRADVGAGCIQNSGMVIEDTVSTSYSVTGDAGTNVITAPGSAFANEQPVMFSSLNGGTGALYSGTKYYVREVSGQTFKLESIIGGGAIDFTSNVIAGSTLWDGHSITPNVAISLNTPATNSSISIEPKGTGAFFLGPRPDGVSSAGGARGNRAVDLQLSKVSASQIASGANSFLVGESNTASGGSAIAAGYSNTASGLVAVALGGQNQATNTGAFVAGGSTLGVHFGNLASGLYSSCPGGIGALADRTGQQSHSSGWFSARGDSQRTRFVLRNKTTTNSAVELFMIGSSRLTIPAGKILALTINICGVKSDGTAVAHYLRQYCLKNVAGTTSQVYAPVTIGSDNAAGTSIALSADDTNDALKVEVTGVLNETWRWTASVDAVEMAYGT